MSTKSQIHTELNRLASLSPSGPAFAASRYWRWQAGSNAVADRSTGLLFRATFRTSADKLANAATIDQLKDIANALSKQLSYLLESISPIEVDDEACIVQMRSNPPQKDDDGTRYYELVVARGRVESLPLCTPLGPNAIRRRRSCNARGV